MQQKFLGSSALLLFIGAGISGCTNDATETSQPATGQTTTTAPAQGLQTVKLNVQGMH